MDRIKLWIRAARAPFLTASIISVILGAAMAWNITGEFHLLKFILTAIGVIFVHSGTNLINDYFDHKSSLDDNLDDKQPKNFEVNLLLQVKIYCEKAKKNLEIFEDSESKKQLLNLIKYVMDKQNLKLKSYQDHCI